MLLQVKQWESKYIRSFDVVRNGEITEELLYQKLVAMYHGYVSRNNIEPFTIAYGRGQGFCINANSYVGVIIYDSIILYINSMIPELTLGKILYMQSQAEISESDTTTRQVLAQNLDDEEEIAAVDYFIISLLHAIDGIQQNGLLTLLQPKQMECHQISGHLILSKQIQKHPSYDVFCVERTQSECNILINHFI